MWSPLLRISVLRGGKTKGIPFTELVVGDVAQFKCDDTFPADGILIQVCNMYNVSWLSLQRTCLHKWGPWEEYNVYFQLCHAFATAKLATLIKSSLVVDRFTDSGAQTETVVVWGIWLDRDAFIGGKKAISLDRKYYSWASLRKRQ